MTRSITMMGTSVTVEVFTDETDRARASLCEQRIDQAFDWFRAVEACCSRFDADSESRRLVARVGDAVPVSDMLFETLQFALALAADTDGAFDPTIGAAMDARGFNRNYRTGAVAAPDTIAAGASYRDVHIDRQHRRVTIARPLVLDLGAVAKGLAVDLAARELAALTDFAIDAGGDLYLGGHASPGQPWSVGIRHPRLMDQTIATLRVSDRAVCTSGDYERRPAAMPHDHHILDPRSGHAATGVASATVVAPTAMVADALATAAFVLGPREGVRLLERHGVEGLIITSSLERLSTQGFHRDYGSDEILPHPKGAAHHHPHRPRDPVGLG